MSEEEEQETTQETKQNFDAANELILKAGEAADRLEKANKETADLLTRQEAAKVQDRLSGTANAGEQGESKDEKADKQARKLIEGTGYEDEIFSKKNGRA